MLAALANPVLLLAAEEEGGGGVEFPPINLIVKWPAVFGEDTFYAFNKIALISLIALLVPGRLSCDCREGRLG